LTQIADGTLSFLGEVLAPDGGKRWRHKESAALSDISAAAALGQKIGAAIRAEAGETFIQNLEKRGW
jgi:hypothetical protein